MLKFFKKNDTFAAYLFSPLRRLNNNFFLNYKPASLAGFFYFPFRVSGGFHIGTMYTSSLQGIWHGMILWGRAMARPYNIGVGAYLNVHGFN